MGGLAAAALALLYLRRPGGEAAAPASIDSSPQLAEREDVSGAEGAENQPATVRLAAQEPQGAALIGAQPGTPGTLASAAGWRLHPARRGGRVRLTSGAATGEGPVLDEACLLRAFAEGGELAVGDERLELLLPGEVRLLFELGSRFVISGAGAAEPGRRDMRIELLEGRVFGLTGADFHGSRMEVATLDGRAEIVGTAFAVERKRAGMEYSCFCVEEGVVHVIEGRGAERREHDVGAASTLLVASAKERACCVRPFPSEPTPHTKPLLDFTAEGMPVY